ncbi:MAG: type I phosphomannose isomerase catalytic subunit [Catenisphaera adipataccumulans]|jgi:glucokinase-like ROK family protein|uniref:type I phosphomannose isomerase catalytic subunit n=1 Tax=Catenisphaera adipataccumulans TaxID=700500 RepID=UPI003D8E52F0
MALLKLKPATKDYIWGGHRLADEYGVEDTGPVIAEAWELSCHPAGPSTIVNGKYAGKTLQEYIDAEGFEVLGTHCRRFREFPILTKFIDAKDNLSIQVHPGNTYALKNEGEYGKTEMWYIIDAEPGSFLYYGFKKEISKEEFEQRIKDNTLLEVLNAVPVHKGDTFFIRSGTLHAIGKGILIAEIQQNSNVTYRIYDYGRMGKDGKPRDLHIRQALDVTNRKPIEQRNVGYPHVADCDYFTVDKLLLDGKTRSRTQGSINEDSFLSILIMDGEGTISSHGETLPFTKGDSFFLSADSGNWQIEGRCEALMTTIREKEDPIRVGINIGSAEIQIGLVDNEDHLLAKEKYPMDNSRAAEDVIDEIAQNTLALLEKNAIPLDRCTVVGVGVPGTIDRKKGTVIYSNNIHWENVELAKRLGKVIPCPVRIANDADCAALGEAVAGAGKDYSDVVMFTLGNGVGGGLILNGEVFEGGIMGGSEIGHTVVRVNGRPCTCGRRGCLEAYASVPALLRAAKEASGKDMPLDEIFRKATHGNIDMQEVVEQYEQMLGTGIVNIVNIFRPQLVLLGGKISEHADVLIPPLEEIMARDCFGGPNSSVPKLAVAELGDYAGMIGAASL